MRRGLLTAVTAAVLLAAAYSASGSPPPLGPDVASYQHPANRAIDWHAVAAHGGQFALVKATEGETYTNPYFSQDYQGALSAGLVRSAYHYARPAAPVQKSAVDQASYFVHAAGTANHKGDLPLTLDLEETGGLSPAELISWTQDFLQEVQHLTGRAPIIYTYPYFWQHAMANSTAFRSYPLWIADYRSSAGPERPLPGGWSSWTFWQYTSRGRLAGIPATVDLDRFNGDTAALQALATPASPGVNGLPVVPVPPLPVHLPAVPKR